MTYSLPEINRTDGETRSILNSKLRDKRMIFEEMIIRTVRALLNSNKTTLELTDKQNFLDKITSTRRKRDKERFARATHALQHATQNAPMGVGSAAGIALSAANTAGSIYYEKTEEKIIENSAKANLDAAKFQIYTPQSDNYNIIARTVARELSFSLQPLLLVLAAGENGIVKLAKFMQKSMKKYAIEKLPEYHSTNSVSEITNALIDASIPPATDDSFYRDFFKIDFYGRKIELGKHTTLEFDPDVRDLLKLAGLDAEIFFGGLNSKEYTIIGALNHAVFLGENYQLYDGIKTPRRAGELATGKLKYPVRLLAPGKSLGTTGVSFAPRPTGIFLEPAHIELLKKLFPNFLSPNALKVSSKEISKDEIYLPDYSSIKYRSERNSVPWSPKRSKDEAQRMAALLAATESSVSKDEIVSIPGYARLKAIRNAGDTFDVNYTRRDLLQGASKAYEIQIASFGTFDDINKKRLLLTSAKYSKYLAIATSYHVHCIIKCSTTTCNDLNTAIEMLDAARTTLNLSRDYPLRESHSLLVARRVAQEALKQEKAGELLQLGFYNNLQNFFEKFQNSIIDNELLSIIPRLLAWRKKILINKFGAISKELNNMIDFVSVLANNPLVTTIDSILTEAQALENFERAAGYFIAILYSPNASIEDMLRKIEICSTETKIIHSEIAIVLDNAHLQPDNFSDIKLNVNTALTRANDILNEAKHLVENLTWLQKTNNNQLVITQLTEKLNSIILQRNICNTALSNCNLDGDRRVVDSDIQTFLARAKIYKKYGRLLFLATMNGNNTNLDYALENLKKTIPTLYRSIEKKIKEELASRQTTTLNNSEIGKNSSIQDLTEVINDLKQTKEKMGILFANDAEVLNRTCRDAQCYFAELQSLIQEILTANEGLLTIIDECENKLKESNFTFDGNYQQQASKIISLFESQESVSPTSVDFFCVIQQLIQNISPELKSEIKIKLNSELTKLLELLLIQSVQPQLTGNSSSDEDLASSTQSESKKDFTYAFNTLEVWIIVKVLHINIQQILNKDMGLYARQNIVQNSLDCLQDTIDLEHQELYKARSIAVSKIKHAYHYITHAQKTKSTISENDSSNNVSSNMLVKSNLEWAVRPTFNELRYLDEKQEKLRSQRFSKQQLYKSEIIIINPLLVRYIKIGIEYLKKQEEALNKLIGKIKNSKDRIFRLQAPSDKHSTEHSLQHIDNRLTRLSAIVEAKLDLILKKIQPLERYKNEFTKHILRAYFGYLKLEVDILESETRIIEDTDEPTKEQSKKHHIQPKQTPSKKPVLYGQENDIYKAANKYSIADLEKHYNELNRALDLNVPSSMKSLSLTDNTPDTSDAGKTLMNKSKFYRTSYSETQDNNETRDGIGLSLFFSQPSAAARQTQPMNSLISEVTHR